MSGATAVTSYGAYTVYELTSFSEDSNDLASENENSHMQISNKEIDSKNYKEPSPVRLCVKKLFDDVEIPESKNPEQRPVDTWINKDDFFTKIDKTEKGCFNMRTEKKTDGNVVGFAELTAIAEDYGLIMQSEINLKKENNNSESYFFNKLLFLKKNNNKWDVQKIISFEKTPTWGSNPIKGKTPDEIVESPKTSIKLWSKESNSDALFQKFDFKIATDFWKSYNSSNFDSRTEGEAYMDGKWYKDSVSTNVGVWHNRIPKGKWTDVKMEDLCNQSDLKDKDFCSKK